MNTFLCYPIPAVANPFGIRAANFGRSIAGGEVSPRRPLQSDGLAEPEPGPEGGPCASKINRRNIAGTATVCTDGCPPASSCSAVLARWAALPNGSCKGKLVCLVEKQARSTQTPRFLLTAVKPQAAAKVWTDALGRLIVALTQSPSRLAVALRGPRRRRIIYGPNSDRKQTVGVRDQTHWGLALPVSTAD